jgi:hypothetical protein
MKQKTAELVRELREMAAAIERSDSFEGSIMYSCLDDGLAPGEWEVSGAYRIGNSDGQGGMRILKEGCT